MGELELVGLHDDGEHLVLAAPDGQRFRLRIDEPLRAAVRRDRPQLEQLRARETGALSPREIQARIRAGATAESVAEDADIPLEHVRRYEGPVLAEREFVAAQARATRVGRDAGAPVLGDLVTDRLATRGVTTGTIEWDAYRDASGPWVVVVRFAIGEAESEARWTYDAQVRSVQALEDEARWLSETEIADEPIPRRHLTAVRDMVFDVEATGAVRPVLASVDGPPPAEPEPEPDPQEQTAALLDDLRGRRGIRQQVELDDDDAEAFEGFGPQHAFDFGQLDNGVPDVPGAHPADADPETEARILVPRRSVLPPPEPEEPEHAPAVAAERPRSGRRGRASVPSWDEIVFGAKPE